MNVGSGLRIDEASDIDREEPSLGSDAAKPTPMRGTMPELEAANKFLSLNATPTAATEASFRNSRRCTTGTCIFLPLMTSLSHVVPWTCRSADWDAGMVSLLKRLFVSFEGHSQRGTGQGTSPVMQVTEPSIPTGPYPYYLA